MTTFIGSTLYSHRSQENLNTDENLNIGQKLTGFFDLAIIAAVTICALLILANNGHMFNLPGLGSLSNPTAFIMFGTAGGVLLVDMITLCVHLVLQNKELRESIALRPPSPILNQKPVPETITQLQNRLGVTQEALEKIANERDAAIEELADVKRDYDAKEEELKVLRAQKLEKHLFGSTTLQPLSPPDSEEEEIKNLRSQLNDLQNTFAGVARERDAIREELRTAKGNTDEPLAPPPPAPVFIPKSKVTPNVNTTVSKPKKAVDPKSPLQTSYTKAEIQNAKSGIKKRLPTFLPKTERALIDLLSRPDKQENLEDFNLFLSEIGKYFLNEKPPSFEALPEDALKEYFRSHHDFIYADGNKDAIEERIKNCQAQTCKEIKEVTDTTKMLNSKGVEKLLEILQLATEGSRIEPNKI